MLKKNYLIAIAMFFLLNIAFYLACSFIAFTWNPMEWWFVTNVEGRACITTIEIMIIVILIGTID